MDATAWVFALEREADVREAVGGKKEEKEACVPTWAHSVFRPPRALRSNQTVPKERLFSPRWEETSPHAGKTKPATAGRLSKEVQRSLNCNSVSWTLSLSLACVVVCSYVDDGVFEFNVQSVVRDGDDGIVCTTQELDPLALQDRERDLERQKTQTWH